MEQLSFDDLEIWKPVPGYEGVYDISSLGRVRSVARIDRFGRSLPERILKHGQHKYGYPVVGLWRDNRQTTRTVHSLIAEAFIGPRPEGMEVRHLDGNRRNCRLSNLAYGTHAENMADMIEHGMSRAKQTHCASGHPFDEENTQVVQQRDGRTRRFCRICVGDAKRRYVERQAEKAGRQIVRRGSGRCQNGHDLMKPGATKVVAKESGTETWCVECERDRRARANERRNERRREARRAARQAAAA